MNFSLKESTFSVLSTANSSLLKIMNILYITYHTSPKKATHNITFVISLKENLKNNVTRKVPNKNHAAHIMIQPFFTKCLIKDISSSSNS